MTTPALLHIRALRRDAYRCRHQMGRGRECGRRGSYVRLREGEYITVCREHQAVEDDA